MAELAALNPIRRGLFDRLRGNWNLDASPAFFLADTMSRLLSPYELNPGNANP